MVHEYTNHSTEHNIMLVNGEKKKKKGGKKSKIK